MSDGGLGRLGLGVGGKDAQGHAHVLTQVGREDAPFRMVEWTHSPEPSSTKGAADGLRMNCQERRRFRDREETATG
jgi:hypothetical protein